MTIPVTIPEYKGSTLRKHQAPPTYPLSTREVPEKYPSALPEDRYFDRYFGGVFPGRPADEKYFRPIPARCLDYRATPMYPALAQLKHDKEKAMPDCSPMEPEMTDQAITGWRTVATHGQPPKEEWVLIAPKGRREAAYSVRIGLRCFDLTTEWMPMSEVAALPDAPPPPPPPRTIPIEISEDYARWLVKNWASTRPGLRLVAAARDALARLDAEDSA